MMEFLALMTLDGREALVNPQYIVSITDAKQADDPGKRYSDAVRCVVALVDGKHITTAEECDHVERRLKELQK